MATKTDIATTTKAPFWMIQELARFREDAHNRKTREKITAELRALETKAQASHLHDPLHPDRPYSLAEEMEGKRGIVWGFIFQQVHDLNSIINLREVCMMFRDLLECKYVAARLPEIIYHCLVTKNIPWDMANRKQTWLGTLLNLRVLSKTTKTSVDAAFQKDIVSDGDPEKQWFCLDSPHSSLGCTELVTWRLGAGALEQVLLQEVLEFLEQQEVTRKPPHPLPLRGIIFDENPEDDVAVDLNSLRNSFQKFLAKVGIRITSFLYLANDNAFGTYMNLRRWLALLPNLEQLVVEFSETKVTTIYKNLPSFPTCPLLKRYGERVRHTFGYPYLNEIVRANPSIEEVILLSMPSKESELNNLVQVLDSLKLTRFHCVFTPTIPFLKHRFQWTQQLNALAIWDIRGNSGPSPPLDIPSESMFAIISSFENLEFLLVSSPYIRYTGGYLKLPKLRQVIWKLFPHFRCLEFLTPAASLQLLDLDVTKCPDIGRGGAKEVMEFVGEWNIPLLFPAMMAITIQTEIGDEYKKVWKRS